MELLDGVRVTGVNMFKYNYGLLRRYPLKWRVTQCNTIALTDSEAVSVHLIDIQQETLRMCNSQNVDINPPHHHSGLLVWHNLNNWTEVPWNTVKKVICTSSGVASEGTVTINALAVPLSALGSLNSPSNGALTKASAPIHPLGQGYRCHVAEAQRHEGRTAKWNHRPGVTCRATGVATTASLC